MLKALLFDLDGTLANTDLIHFVVWRDLLLEYGLEVTPTFYQAHFSGRLNDAIIQELLPNLPAAERETLSDRKEADFRKRATGELQPLAGVAEILTWAETQELKTAVVTNAPAENARFMLNVLKLVDRLPIVVLGEALERGKPDPLPYQVALQRLNVPATDAIAFEDSPAGIRSAIAAGILTVGIASTHSPQALYDLGVTLVVSDFADPQLKELLTFSFPSATELLKPAVRFPL